MHKENNTLADECCNRYMDKEQKLAIVFQLDLDIASADIVTASSSQSPNECDLQVIAYTTFKKLLENHIAAAGIFMPVIL